MNEPRRRAVPSPPPNQARATARTSDAPTSYISNTRIWRSWRRSHPTCLPTRPWPATQRGWPTLKSVPAARGFGFPRFHVAEGMPYALACRCRWCLYKNLGVSNTDIAFYELALSAVGHQAAVGRRGGGFAQQPGGPVDLDDPIALGAGLAGVALTIPTPHFFQLTLAFFLVAGIQFRDP